jgi:hypothetical protein
MATLLVVFVLGSALSAAIGTGVHAASTVASGAAVGASAGAPANKNEFASTDNVAGYFVDSLFRPTDPARLAAAGAQGNSDAAAQATRILINGVAAGQVPDADKAYLEQLVAARTGLSEADAKARVDAVLAMADEAKAKAQQGVDAARKSGATVALIGALSLIIGAFIASVAAAIGGRQRDDEEALFQRG